MSSRSCFRNTRRDFEKYFVAAILTLAGSMDSGLRAGGLQSETFVFRVDNKGSGSTFVPNPILTLDVRPAVQPIIIDGVIEEAWNTGAHFDNFVENWPNERQKPKVLTEGYVTHDDKNLYIAFICYEPEMSKLRATLSDRDNLYQDDFVGLNLDAYGARVNGYEFFVNPLGIQADLSVDVNGNEDDSFDAVWESDAKIYEDRWTVEMKIPFKSLRYPDKVDQDWLVHLWRIYPRENRYLYSWMPRSKDVANQYAEAGHLKMQIGETSGKTFEVLPYVVGSTDRSLVDKSDGVNGQWGHRHFDQNAGFNVKYGVSSNLTLDLAYNPDFSQIEADAGQISVNNTFALFYNEKRPFFLEGKDIFFVDNDINLLYTRSINDPLVMGKLSGKVGQLSFGYIAGYDQSTPFILPFEERSSAFSTNRNSTTNILRVKYDIGGGSYLGFVGTDRQMSHGGNAVGTMDAKIRLNSKYTLSAMAGLSHTNEIRDSTLSADNISDVSFKADGHVYSSAFDGERFDGQLYRVTLDRTARNWGFFAWFNDRSPGFRSDNGFINNNNLREVGAYNRYTFFFDQSHPLIAYIQPRVQFNRRYNYDGKLKDWWINPQLFIQFKRQTYVFIGVVALKNTNFGGKQFDDIHLVWFETGTQIYKKLYGGFYTETGNYINRGGDIADPRNPLAKAKGFYLQVWLTAKPTSQLSDQIDYRQFNLWTRYGGPLIGAQKIFRNTLAYQFTKQLFLRVIGEYDLIDQYDSDVQAVDHSQYFSVESLASYKINPFTVFFLGARIGGQKDPYPNHDGLSTTNQTIFVKFQYFMRI